jgi:RNA polymerase sigma-70 factor, ECF subfamily
LHGLYEYIANELIGGEFLEHLEKSIETIYEQYYRDVYRFLIVFTGNQNDAEDLTQEVFIRVLKSLSKFNHHYPFKTWVLSIAKHVAIDHYRRKKFYSIFREHFFQKMHSKEGLPYSALEKKTDKEDIYKAIAKLKPNYRSVLILRGINELSVKETAEILNCSESKVKVDYHRALQKLKKLLNVSVSTEERREETKNAN